MAIVAVVAEVAVVAVVTEGATMLSVLRPNFFTCNRKKSKYNRKYSRKEHNQQMRSILANRIGETEEQSEQNQR